MYSAAPSGVAATAAVAESHNNTTGITKSPIASRIFKLPNVRLNSVSTKYRRDQYDRCYRGEFTCLPQPSGKLEFFTLLGLEYNRWAGDLWTIIKNHGAAY